MLKLLVDGGVDTIAKYAFVSSFVPGGSDEKPFLDAIRSLLKKEPSIGELSVLRRLHVECYSLTAAEKKSRLRGPPTTRPSRPSEISQQCQIDDVRPTPHHESRAIKDGPWKVQKQSLKN